MNKYKVPEGWVTGIKEGYYTKTIKVGNCSTCVIHRPFLTDQERKKREEEVCRALAAFVKI